MTPDAGAPPDAHRFVPHPVPPSLQPWVTALWWQHGPGVRRFEKVFPMQAVHLIVPFEGPYRVVSRGGAAVGDSLEVPFVSGIQTRWLVNENPAVIANMGAEFTPLGIAAFTAAPPVELTDRVRAAEPVLPGAGELMAFADAEPGAALAGLQHFLEERLRPGFTASESALAAWQRILDEPDTPIAEIAAGSGVSHKTLIAAFRRHCGLTPKVFADLCRFRAFIDALPVTGQMPRWSELVAGTGYYDQPHFVRAFRRFTGFTPSGYLEALREFGPGARWFVPMEQAG